MGRGDARGEERLRRGRRGRRGVAAVTATNRDTATTGPGGPAGGGPGSCAGRRQAQAARQDGQRRQQCPGVQPADLGGQCRDQSHQTRPDPVAIVFCNRKTTVRELASSLKRSGFAVGQIQGDMEQAARIAEFDRFKNDEITILVASDVAARGLDVKGVSHVINFDVPWQPDDYIHRIGRTGRAGLTGIAITLATREDSEAVAGIEKLIGHKIPRAGSALADAKPVEERKAEKPQARPEKRAPRADKPKAAEQPAKTASEPEKAVPAEKKPRAAKPPPAVEDLQDEWNGPVPSFLSFGAD